jgi:hypothetical protein
VVSAGIEAERRPIVRNSDRIKSLETVILQNVTSAGIEVVRNSDRIKV